MIPALAALALAAAPVPPTWEKAAEAAARNFVAEGRIVVRPGERVVVRFDADFTAHVESVGPASGAVFSTEKTVQDGAVAFSLGEDAQAGWVLKAENGLAAPVVYGALIGVGAGENIALAPTSICAVPPHVVGLEMWRAPLVLIALGPFAPRAEGQGRCETLAPPPANIRPGAPIPPGARAG